jgi:predicted regulator of amino acid metabolism with ACT domain
MITIKDKVSHQQMGRLTQAIVSSGHEIKSKNLSKLIEDYTRDNIQSKEFPKEMRMNLTRIAEATGMDKMHVKETLSQSISMTDLSEIKNLQSQQAELYIRTVVEIEGKNLSAQSVQQLIKLVEDSTVTIVSKSVSASLTHLGFTF